MLWLSCLLADHCGIHFQKAGGQILCRWQYGRHLSTGQAVSDSSTSHLRKQSLTQSSAVTASPVEHFHADLGHICNRFGFEYLSELVKRIGTYEILQKNPIGWMNNTRQDQSSTDSYLNLKHLHI